MLYWYPYEGPLMPIYSTVFQDLIKSGHKITIVTSFPHYRKGRVETWGEFRGKLYKITEEQNITLIRTYVCAPKWLAQKLSMLYRGLNFISFNISSLIVSVACVKKPDLVFAPSSPPLTNAIISYCVSRLKRCKMIYNVQDLYPDMALKLDIVKNKYIFFALRAVEQVVYKLSDTILTISADMGRIIHRKGVPWDKISTIENFIDTDFITPEKKENAFSREFSINGYFVVMYAGNIGLPHGLEVAIQAAELLQEKKDILFCFVARGENKENIRKMAFEKELPNVRFIEPQPQERVPQIWAAASVGLVTYRTGLADFSVPSKLLAIMCAARPVLASLDFDTEPARIVSQAECGLVVEPEDPEALTRAVLGLRNNPIKAKEMGRKARSFVERNFQRKSISKKYERLFLSQSVRKPVD